MEVKQKNSIHVLTYGTRLNNIYIVNQFKKKKQEVNFSLIWEDLQRRT